MAKREIFDEQQKIAIAISGIDKISREQFLNSCTCFDVNENLDYQLPTPEEVYNNFSRYKAPEGSAKEKMMSYFPSEEILMNDEKDDGTYSGKIESEEKEYSDEPTKEVSESEPSEETPK
jgi:hypothetical protein